MSRLDFHPDRYSEGDRVVYWRPGGDAILASWSGRRPRQGDGEERTVTITAVSVERDPDSGAVVGYYDTDAGVMLTDSDIRRQA